MSTRPLTYAVLGLALAVSSTACDKGNEASVQADDATPVAAEPEPDTASEKPAFPDLASALAGAHRDAEHQARDVARHPSETLAFFGVERSMTVVELWPGGGWYTEILGPFLRDEGTFIVTNWPSEHERYGKWAKAFEEKVGAAPEIFGDLTIVTAPIAPEETFVLAPEGSVDVVLTFRNSHGWFNNGQTEQIYSAAFKALAPGGIFGIVQHRAPEGANAEESSKTGYLPEALVIEHAQKVGFELVESSAINANPKDTKDYASGVWTLPPNFAGPEKDVEQSAEDKAKYTEIGESDRMTLKFRKPA